MKRRKIGLSLILAMVAFFGFSAFIPANVERTTVNEKITQVSEVAPAHLAEAAGKTVVIKGCWVATCDNDEPEPPKEN